MKPYARPPKAPVVRPRARLTLLALLVAWSALAPTGARAQDRAYPVEVENIRVGLEDVYRIGTWTPVWVDLTSREGAFAGMLSIEVPDEDGKPTSYQTPVAVDAARGVATFVGYVRPGARMSEITVRVADERGRRASRPVRPEDLPGGRSPTSLDPSQVVLVTLGNPQGVGEVASMSGFTDAAAPGGSMSDTGLAVLSPRIPGGLPGRWYGFDAAEAVVVDTNDEAVIDALRERGEALRLWVRNGGHLVVAGLAHWQVTRELLGDLLPAVPVGTTRLNDSGEIEAFAGSSTNQLLPLGGSMLVADLQGLDARGGRALAATTELPLIVRGSYGFGRVTLIGFDVDQPPFADWEDRAPFWARAVDVRPPSTGPVAATPGGGGAFFQNQTSDLSSLLYRALDRPPGVSLVPFGWVAFFVFVYILLIGPGDYFFLKRVVRRMELTWITFPAIVVVVSALAYVAAYRLKGTELKVVKLDVVDVDARSGLVRGSSWMTLFSPQNRDYDVSVLPSAPAGGEAVTSEAGSRTGLPEPPAGVERLVSWFGPADPRFGGGGGGLSLSGDGYAYGPPGELDALFGVRIPIWSTKSFEARWTAPGAGGPVVEADLEAVGSDRVAGTITNVSDRTLEDAVLIFGSSTGAVAYDQLGAIAPGASVTIDVATRLRPLSGYLEERSRQFLTPDGTLHLTGDESGIPGIADIARVAMFRGGMPERTSVPPATVLGDLDLTGLVTLGRPMLVARVDAPLAELSLGGAPGEPQVVQTTMLRVLLPLGGPDASRAGATALRRE